MDLPGRFQFLNIWILRLNNIFNSTSILPTFFGICLELKIWSPISFLHLFLLKQLFLEELFFEKNSFFENCGRKHGRKNNVERLHP